MSRETSQKGSLTLEATISMSIFILAIFSIAFIMRIVFLHSMIQHAICDTANQVATFSYISYRAEPIAGDAYAALMNSKNDSKETTDKESYNQITDILKNIALNRVAGETFKYFVGKSIEYKGNVADTRLKRLGVVGGFDGLDFSASKYLEDEKTFDIVVCYKVKALILPELSFVQRAASKAWLGGEYMASKDNIENQSCKSLWDLDNSFKRGILFQKKLGFDNLPSNFPTLTYFDSKTGKAVSVHSTDIRTSTYLKGNGFETKTKKLIDKLYDFKGASYGGTTINGSSIKSKTLIMVMPKMDKLPDNIKNAQAECIKYAQTKGIKIEFIQDDGAYSPSR